MATLPAPVPSATQAGAMPQGRPATPALLLQLYRNLPQMGVLQQALSTPQGNARVQGTVGSLAALVAAALHANRTGVYLFILPDREAAAYFHNDLQTFAEGKEVLFMPSATRRPYDDEQEHDDAQVLLRAEVLNQLNHKKLRGELIVTHPEALAEKVVNKITMAKNTVEVKRGARLNLDFMMEVMAEFSFDRVDFVYGPGQYSIRGGILDVFSFSNDLPYRIEMFGDDVESIRTFDPETQLSVNAVDNLSLLPNVQTHLLKETREGLLTFLPPEATVWVYDAAFTAEVVQKRYDQAATAYQARQNASGGSTVLSPPEDLYESGQSFFAAMERHPIVEFGGMAYYKQSEVVRFESTPQPAIRKDFKLLAETMLENERAGFQNLLFSEQPKQLERLYTIMADVAPDAQFTAVNAALHEGFVDRATRLAVFTDHQIFERYHKYKLKNYKARSQAITLKELRELKPGDFVTHIDHGVGTFAGMEVIEVNGKPQETIRILYKDNDTLNVGINSLHKIAKYSGKEGHQPKLNKLGSDSWEKLKSRTKRKVKDIAKDLIALYAKRKAQRGFAFTRDTYLQNELEASFIYEDTPDQFKASEAVKADMEREYPMDRLVCGDVGFGKTEVAIRAAFKAATDGKQVAILVPTTILALQHWKTFKERLKEFPVRVDYLNRFRTAKQKKELLQDLAAGKVDIVVGTHGLVGKEVKFKDLGLMIIDEEQKFGVAVKEKLKQLRANVDSLTLTATPIPRTLQFSLMGARDLSVINTPPPNRQPIQTEMLVWDEDRIRDAIMFEVERGGQAFFVHNRVGNIKEVADMIRRLCPGVRVGMGHGQMEGDELEDVMLEFIDGQQDVLVATNIIESGLDIPNANTIIINQAQNFGLSDLHQMRGRVGRSNKRAFAYLLVPPLSVLTTEARRRLKAIEEFSELGSGFNIALKDLDIRGAGNLLGGEQSGFITEIGYELYHKILDEAVQELKETDFADVFADQPPKPYVDDCQVDTDWEALIPSDYVTNSPERLNLYMQLDRIETEAGLERFEADLQDRFGPVPGAVGCLLQIVRIRRRAMALGIEKLVLKKGSLRATFTQRRQEEFYNSDAFGRVLAFVQAHPARVHMKQNGPQVSLEVKDVKDGDAAMAVLDGGLSQD